MKLERIENGFCETEYKIIRADGKYLIVSASDLKELWKLTVDMGIV